MWEKNLINGFHVAVCPYTVDTLNNRLPKLINDAIIYFNSSYKNFLNKKHSDLKASYHPQINNEIKKINFSLNDLLNKIKTNNIIPVFHDENDDAVLWNSYLKEYEKNYNKQPKFKELNAIAVESFVYRSLNSTFSSTTFFKKFDAFYQLKLESLVSCKSIANLLLAHTVNLKERLNRNKTDVETEFSNYLKFSTWGNKADLTIPAGKTAGENFNFLEDSKKINNILVDSSKNIIDSFIDLSNKEKELKIDVVLDNCGLELISDLCLIEMLYQTKLIDENLANIKFHVKAYPWFVSDVTLEDFNKTLNYFELNSTNESNKNLVKKWMSLIKAGKWKICTNIFWTCPFEFDKMDRVSPDLFNELKKSNFLFLKGDLNYIKLMGNLLWPPTTSFDVAIQSFKPTNLASLRTAKYNLIVGLLEEDILKKLPKDWYENGDYAMIYYFKK